MKKYDFDDRLRMGEDGISMVADFSGNEESLFDAELDDEIAILPLRNMVLFPGVLLPVSVGRESSLALIKKAEARHKPIGVVCQKDPNVEQPTASDLYKIGTVARVVRILEMPDSTISVILQGSVRFEWTTITGQDPYITAKVTKLEEVFPRKKNKEFEALIESCKDLAIQYVQKSDMMRNESSFAIKNISNDMFLINFICANIPFPIEDKQDMLKEGNLHKRALKLLSLLSREVQLQDIKMNIQMRTREEIDQQQREYFLQQQIKNIQDELGNSIDQDFEELQEQAKKKKWSENVQKIFEKELSKLERTNTQSPDYNVQLNYLQTMLSLPWNKYTKDNLNLQNAQKVLDKDHYGLEKVKERILEYLSVLKLRGDLKSPIICLYGPPGVGKTSLGKSVAAALNRKYVRISLGGLHDESEIRGHRRTYIGAMPGQIIKNIAKAGSSNPVFILDEIDKVTQETINGDPASALLEVLDPEQNNAFHDNYLDVDYDLSKVLFIATANNLNTIPAPLLDRMELIEVSGYVTEEKIEIARRHLIPKELDANGMKSFNKKLKLPKETIEAIIELYTRESGVRELEKKIGKIFRRLARKYATEGEDAIPSSIKPSDLKDLLGVQEFSRDKYQGNNYAGVVTGLAWTAVGGEILFIETSLSKGKGGKLTLTGNLGDVMKESAMLALEFIKAHTNLLNIDSDIFDNWNIHIHVPEGAVPKDGPSAGITIATSLASALTQRKVEPNLAMTGEITLRGKVLPVGGIREKILAAKRAGIKEIILSDENRKDIGEIPELYIKGLTFHFVKDVKEVFSLALTDEKVAGAIDFAVNKEENK